VNILEDFIHALEADRSGVVAMPPGGGGSNIGGFLSGLKVKKEKKGFRLSQTRAIFYLASCF